MHFGTQLTAPNGWGDWSKTEQFYFGGVYDAQVLIVSFYVHNDAWRVSVRHETSEVFERALTGSPKKIVRNETQHTLPPWLEEFDDDVDFDSCEEYRYKKKKQKYSDQVQKRKSAIEPLLARQDEILSSGAPLSVITKIGRESAPTQHPYRLQLWFFAFILFAKNIWALKACCTAIGKWDRSDDKYSQKKFGRPYKEKGSEYGWSSLHFSEKVTNAYLSYCRQYKTMTAIHRRALIDNFGMIPEKHDSGRRSLIQPLNLPYPSYGQFRQIVVAAFGLTEVQTTLYGQVRCRNRAKVDEGSFVAQLKNVLERIEVDAYRCDDRPKAMFSNEAMPALIVARAVCVKTGAIVGVGFSLGGEKREAYRSMLLCMSLPKTTIAKIYGIPVEMLEWPMSGLSPSMLSDRGPAGFESLLDGLEKKIPIKSGTPSYQPRSKPTVEGSNPKSVGQEGAPSFILSDLDVPSMMRRELMRATQQNRSKDITSHMSEAELLDFHRLGLPATPQAYFCYLSDRLRTSGIKMSPVQAIKAFGKRVPLEVDGIGMVLHDRHYSSIPFRSEGLHLKAVKLRAKHLTGYTVELATRYVWVEFAGKLLELEAMKSGSSIGEDYFTPLSALEAFGESLSEVKSRTRKSGQAAIVESEIDFKKLTGIAWDAGVSRSGTPKKGRGTVTHETAIMNDKLKVGRK